MKLEWKSFGLGCLFGVGASQFQRQLDSLWSFSQPAASACANHGSGVQPIDHRASQSCSFSSISGNFNRTSYPGRFKHNAYNNLSVSVKFATNRKGPKPYETNDCAPGLTCKFYDKSWHEVSWQQNVIKFPLSPEKLRDSISISLESAGRCGTLGLSADIKGVHAGLALTDPQSDIPLSYGNIHDIFQPKSNEIKVWRILHIASNCKPGVHVQSSRNRWVEALRDRNLLDSYGSCHHNKDYNATERYPPKLKVVKEGLVRKYAFVTAFENSYYPGYVTEKLWEPLKLGSLPIYQGAPNVRLMFPERSFINVDDFATHDDLADYIEFLIEDKYEYDQHHTWREKGVSTELEEFWKFADQDTNCRICQWGAENLCIASENSEC